MTDQETIDQAERVIAKLQWPTPHSSAHIAQALADAGLLADEDHETYVHLTDRQSELLTGAVNALRGDPPPMTTWSHHDVSELAHKAVAERDALAATVQRVREALGRVVLDHRYTGEHTSPAYAYAADYIRAALDDPQEQP